LTIFHLHSPIQNRLLYQKVPVEGGLWIWRRRKRWREASSLSLFFPRISSLPLNAPGISHGRRLDHWAGPGQGVVLSLAAPDPRIFDACDKSRKSGVRAAFRGQYRRLFRAAATFVGRVIFGSSGSCLLRVKDSPPTGDSVPNSAGNTQEPGEPDICS
jgi:hypothetical protein